MTIQYCVKRYREQDGKTYYMDIFPHIKTVQCYADKDEKIYEIDVSETKEIDENSYYGWIYSDGDGKILFIYPVLSLVDMCFAYGYKAEEDYGIGRLVRVKIEEKYEITHGY